MKNLGWMPLMGAFLAGATMMGGSLALTGCNKSSGGALVTVNGETVTLDQFHKYLEGKNTARVITNNNQVANMSTSEPIGFQGLQDMIQQKLILQMAADEGVKPTDDDLTKEIEFQKKRDPNFLKRMTSQGFNVEELKERLKIDLARERLITKGINITSEDAKTYVKEHPKEFIEPATIDSLIIVVQKDDEKSQVDQELARGQGFEVVAKKYSKLPGAKSDAHYKDRVVDAMPGPIKALLNKTAAATTSDWVKLSDGWAKFYVQQKTPEKPITMDDTRYEVVRRQMAVQKGMRARDIDRTLLEKYKAAKIDVAYAPFKEQFTDFTKRLKEESANAAK